MMKLRDSIGLVLPLALILLVNGCSKNGSPSGTGGDEAVRTTTDEATSQTEGASEAEEITGWGTIKGKVVWSGDLPKLRNVEITKDVEWCNVAVPDETIVVDPNSMGVLNVIAYIKRPREIHPDERSKEEVHEDCLKKFEEDNGVTLEGLQAALDAGTVKVADLKTRVIIDQLRCRYAPHALAVRVGEITLVKNAEQVTHNVKISGFGGLNDANPNMPPGTVQVFEWSKETHPLSIQCNIHTWMNMYAMVFDHPYFAATDSDGSFEIKNVPAGEVTLVLRNPKYIDPLKGGKGNAKGATFMLGDGETKDLGEIRLDKSFLE